MRAHTGDVVSTAIGSGRPIEVETFGAYINLYHAFQRMQRTNQSLRRLTLVRRKINETRWWVFAVNRKDLQKPRT